VLPDCGSTANACIAFTTENVTDEEGDEQLSRKRRHFLIQNEYF
jgi:hypothetical protein